MLHLDDPRLVTTWSRLQAAGYSAAHIRAQLAAGRWQRFGHAIVLHNGPLSPAQRLRVGLVHAGPSALLTALTALAVYGLKGWEREAVYVIVPRGGRVLPSPVPLVVRRVRDWSTVRRDRSGPVHARVQAVLTAAAMLSNGRSACGVVAAAVQQRIVTAEGLRRELEAHPKLRHRKLVAAALADLAQGSQALSEIDFAALCRRFRLPAPDRQTIRRQRDGKRRYLDATWRRRDGRLVVAEVDGALHTDQRRWWDDQFRQNEITLGDAVVLRFPSAVVRCEPEVVAGQLRRALGM